MKDDNENRNSNSKHMKLVENMCAASLSNPNMVLSVALGTQDQEGIGFEQFSNLFDSMEAACNRSLIHFTKYELLTEFFFDKNIVGIFTMDGYKPKFVKRYSRSKLLLQNEFNASLHFMLMEVHNTEPVDAGIPLQIQIYEKWTFTHKNKVKYELLKTTQGKTKEDACNQEPIFLVRMYIVQEICSPLVYANVLVKKSFDVFGYGSNPNLFHVPSQHKGKRKEVNI